MLDGAAIGADMKCLGQCQLFLPAMSRVNTALVPECRSIGRIVVSGQPRCCGSAPRAIQQ